MINIEKLDKQWYSAQELVNLGIYGSVWTARRDMHAGRLIATRFGKKCLFAHHDSVVERAKYVNDNRQYYHLINFSSAQNQKLNELVQVTEQETGTYFTISKLFQNIVDNMIRSNFSYDCKNSTFNP